MKEQLISIALQAREAAYTPHSKFKVGAMVLTKSEKVYTGCNIENSSYALTCCAERVAIFKAVSEGETEFKALAVVGETDEPISPCGACRQVMAEFFHQDVSIYLGNINGDIITTSIEELLPFSFKL